jgi:hypothetical protein
MHRVPSRSKRSVKLGLEALYQRGLCAVSDTDLTARIRRLLSLDRQAVHLFFFWARETAATRLEKRLVQCPSSSLETARAHLLTTATYLWLKTSANAALNLEEKPGGLLIPCRPRSATLASKPSLVSVPSFQSLYRGRTGREIGTVL